MVAAVLYARVHLHRFVRSCLNEAELRDALIFAAATLVVLPLLPDDPLDPWGVLNLRKILIVVILIMAISGAGYIAVRLLGVNFGLPVSGFASGFASSSATIGAMASRVKDTPALLKPAARRRGAVDGGDRRAARTAARRRQPVGAEGDGDPADAERPGSRALWRRLHPVGAEAFEPRADTKPGRAFSLGTALALAATLAVILVASAALQAWLGETGLVIATAVAGLRRRPFGGGLRRPARPAPRRSPPSRRCCRCWRRFTTNTVTKIVLAFTGPRSFALSVVPGLLLVVAAAWAGAFLAGGKLV